jgi:hypothetical protein
VYELMLGQYVDGYALFNLAEKDIAALIPELGLKKKFERILSELRPSVLVSYLNVCFNPLSVLRVRDT